MKSNVPDGRLMSLSRNTVVPMYFAPEFTSAEKAISSLALLI